MASATPVAVSPAAWLVFLVTIVSGTAVGACPWPSYVVSRVIVFFWGLSSQFSAQALDVTYLATVVAVLAICGAVAYFAIVNAFSTLEQGV